MSSFEPAKEFQIVDKDIWTSVCKNFFRPHTVRCYFRYWNFPSPPVQDFHNFSSGVYRSLSNYITQNKFESCCWSNATEVIGSGNGWFNSILEVHSRKALKIKLTSLIFNWPLRLLKCPITARKRRGEVETLQEEMANQSWKLLTKRTGQGRNYTKVMKFFRVLRNENLPNNGRQLTSGGQKTQVCMKKILLSEQWSDSRQTAGKTVPKPWKIPTSVKHFHSRLRKRTKWKHLSILYKKDVYITLSNSSKNSNQTIFYISGKKLQLFFFKAKNLKWQAATKTWRWHGRLILWTWMIQTTIRTLVSILGDSQSRFNETVPPCCNC